MTPKKKAKRVRRTADDARREIVDATERKLRELGPAGIRLQQIAEEVGVSHPAILHHFGSREGLIQAVVRQAIERLEADLLRVIAEPPTSGKPLGTELIDRAFDVLVKGGHARVVAWLLLSGQWNISAESRMRAIAEAAYARRLQLEGDASNATLEDTTFRMVLVALTIFGEALAGDAMRESAGIADANAADRFRDWLAELILDPREK
ncbi:MAG TPA: TetR/AcrR family transcriptional regulator [Polyangiaceae bacterium]|jgi:AcrR family transcriptional regulator|nr:TetR/AcrR family transcriptional regulator [Polyangiaceae bacterium]